MTDQPSRKSETPDAPKGGEKREGYPKLAGDSPRPSKAPAEKPPAEGNKAPARLEAPGGRGEKSGNERAGYPALARSESPAAPTGGQARSRSAEPARSAEGSSSAREKPAPGTGRQPSGERPGYPQLAKQQPPAESKPPTESKLPGKGDKPRPGPPPPENPPEPPDAYKPRPRPAAPAEAPRTGDGNVDYTAWGERLKAKGVGGDVDGRVARANNGDKDMAAELRTAERYRDAGYQTSLAPPKENAGVRNPDLDARYHGASPPENQPLKAEVKSRTDGPMTRSRLNGQVDEANAQIKNSNREGTGRGDVIYDASGVNSRMSQADVEKFVGGKMRGHRGADNARLSQVDYLEVMYRNPDNGALQRTYSVRTPDGHVAGPFTEVFG